MNKKYLEYIDNIVDNLLPVVTGVAILMTSLSYTKQDKKRIYKEKKQIECPQPRDTMQIQYAQQLKKNNSYQNINHIEYI